MAMLDCVCGVIFPVRAAAQFAQAQFHCGRPPPAALPRIWMRINPEFSESDNYVRSNRPSITGALEKDRNGLQHRFDPLLFCSSHKSGALIEHMGRVGKLFFDKADVAAAFDASKANLGKIVEMCIQTHILLQVVRGDVVTPHHPKIALAVAHDDVRLAFD